MKNYNDLSIADLKKLAKSLEVTPENGGLSASKINSFNKEELIDYLQLHNLTDVVEDTETNEVAVQGTDTFVTEKGEIVPIVSASFARMTSNGAFVFQMENGVEIVTNDSDIRFLKMKGGLVEGDVIAFKPETIQFNAQMNMHTGVVNKSASPKLMSVVNFRTESKHINLAMQAELTASGIALQDAKALIQDKIASEVLSSFKRPTFTI